jgi:hypothetical protein
MEDNSKKIQISSHREISVFQIGTWVAANNSHSQEPACYKILYRNMIWIGSLPVSGYCEHGNEPLHSIKNAELLY